MDAVLKKNENGNYVFESRIFGGEIEISADDGVSEDYIRRCAEDLENMPDAVMQAICEGAKRYCLWFIEMEKDAMGDSYAVTERYHAVTADTPAAEMRPLFDIYCMNIETPEDESILAYSIGAGCNWEPEHGFDVLIKDQKVIYVGACEGYSPWDTEYFCEGEGTEWNFALEQ